MKAKALIFVLALAMTMVVGKAFAQVQATDVFEVSTNSNEVPQFSPCWEAGTLTLALQEGPFGAVLTTDLMVDSNGDLNNFEVNDDGSVLTAGVWDETETIQARLPLNVTSCVTLDYQWAFADAADLAALPVVDLGSDTDVAPDADTVADVQVTTPGARLQVVIEDGTQVVDISLVDATPVQPTTVNAVAPAVAVDTFIRVIADSAATDAAPNFVAFTFFDGTTTAGAPFFLPDPALNESPGDIYTDTLMEQDPAENTLCINVSNFAGTTVDLSLDSADTNPNVGRPFSYDPEARAQIADIINALNIGIGCAKSVCPDVTTVVIENPLQFGDDTIIAEFCYSENKGVEFNQTVCPEYGAQRIVIENASAFDPQTEYVVSLTLLVNGMEGTDAYSFASTTLDVEGYTTEAEACSAAGLNRGAERVVFNGTDAGFTIIDNNGDEVLPGDLQLPNSDGEFAPGDTIITGLSTPPSTAIVQPGNRFIVVEVPCIVWDQDLVSDGDEISVRVDLTIPPCSTVTVGEVCLFNYVDECPVDAVADTDCLLYPFFRADIEPGNPNTFNGISIVNLENTDATALITRYEEDGDIWEATVTVPALNAYVNTLGMVNWMAAADSAGDGDPTTTRSFATVVIDREATGFGFASTGAPAGESFSYRAVKTGEAQVGSAEDACGTLELGN
jgi:hypothetical protein